MSSKVSQPFVFLHIPKAAGTTLREIVCAEINPKQRLNIDDISRIAYTSDEWLNSHDFISGHFGVSLLSRLNAGCRVITMLRHPVARTISQYKYFKQLAVQGGDFNGYAELVRDRGLKNVLSDRSDVYANSLFRNTQTWALVSDYQHHYRDFLMPDDEVLAIAKERLEKMNFFGLVEAMEDSLRGLNAVFGWNIKVEDAILVKSNSSSNVPEDNDEGLKDIILEHNQLDLALYNWAGIRFREKLSVLSESQISHQPAIAELTDWKNLRFPEYLSSEAFSLANREISIKLLMERVLLAEATMSQQSIVNKELRRWAEDAEQRVAQRAQQLAEEREDNLQLRKVLNNRRKLFARLISLRLPHD